MEHKKVLYVSSLPAIHVIMERPPDIEPFLNNLFIADTLQLMNSIPDNSIDLIIADGPYANKSVGRQHEWDNVRKYGVNNIQEFNLLLIEKFSRILKRGGSLYLFGEDQCVDFIDYRKYLKLNSKIVWFQPSRLSQGKKSFTRSYDLICYFSKGEASTYNLDEIRIPQLVSEVHQKRCEKVPSVANGKYYKTRFNPDGKNPGDVWMDIKQLTYKSKELLSRDLLNTIQKPEKLMERIIKASSQEGDVIFDPFSGSGSALVTALRLNRQAFGCEINRNYAEMALERIKNNTQQNFFLIERDTETLSEQCT